MVNAWLAQERSETNDKGEEVKFTYEERINSVRGDSTGQGDMPMEYLQAHTRLPVGEESHVKFTLQSKNEMYLTSSRLSTVKWGIRYDLATLPITRLLRSSRNR